MSADDYPWNVRLNIGGVTFYGPGMESQQEAEAIKRIIEGSDEVQNLEVEPQ